MKEARITKQEDSFYVIFGFKAGNDFLCANGKKAKFYKSKKNADKAKLLWERG